MQLEFTKLIAAASANRPKPAATAGKKTIANRPQPKHIAEQFEFPFVRQLTGSAQHTTAA